VATTHVSDETARDIAELIRVSVPQLFARMPVAIQSVSVSRPSLDDVFMSYTGKTIRDAEASIGDRNRMIATRFGRR